MDRLELFALRAGNANGCSNPIAIAFRSDQFQLKPVVRVAAIIAVQMRGRVIVRDEDIQIAVAIEIAVGRSAGDQRLRENAGYILELASAGIVKQTRQLRILDLRLHRADFFFEMTVCREDIRPAIQIVIEKENTEGQVKKTGASDRRTRRLIGKQAVAVVVVEREHLIGKITDNQVLSA